MIEIYVESNNIYIECWYECTSPEAAIKKRDREIRNFLIKNLIELKKEIISDPVCKTDNIYPFEKALDVFHREENGAAYAAEKIFNMQEYLFSLVPSIEQYPETYFKKSDKIRHIVALATETQKIIG